MYSPLLILIFPIQHYFCTKFTEAKKPPKKKKLNEEEKDQGVEMTQDFEGEMFDIPSDDENDQNDSEGTFILAPDYKFIVFYLAWSWSEWSEIV